MSASQAERREFEPRLPLHFKTPVPGFFSLIARRCRRRKGTVFPHLVNTADRWRDLLNGGREAEKSAEDAANAPSPEAQAPGFPPGAFIPV